MSAKKSVKSLPSKGKSNACAKWKNGGFAVVEHGFQAVGAAACEDGFYVVLVNVQAGAKRADKPCRAGETRQLLHFVQQEQSRGGLYWLWR